MGKFRCDGILFRQHGQFNCLNLKKLSREAWYKNTNVTELLEVKISKCGSKSNLSCDDGNLVKKMHGHLCWKILTTLKVHPVIKEAISEKIWRQINFFKNSSFIWSIWLKTPLTKKIKMLSYFLTGRSVSLSSFGNVIT